MERDKTIKTWLCTHFQNCSVNYTKLSRVKEKRRRPWHGQNYEGKYLYRHKTGGVPFVQEPSHNVDLSFNYKTQTLDQLVDSN